MRSALENDHPENFVRGYRNHPQRGCFFVERRSIEIHTGVPRYSCSGTLWLIHVRFKSWTLIYVLRHDYELVSREFRKNKFDLCIRKVLQHLANQTKLAFGEIVIDDVQTFECDVFVAELLLIVLNQRRYDVYARILLHVRPKPCSHIESATTQ